MAGGFQKKPGNFKSKKPQREENPFLAEARKNALTGLSVEVIVETSDNITGYLSAYPPVSGSENKPVFGNFRWSRSHQDRNYRCESVRFVMKKGEEVLEDKKYSGAVWTDMGMHYKENFFFMRLFNHEASLDQAVGDMECELFKSGLIRSPALPDGYVQPENPFILSSSPEAMAM